MPVTTIADRCRLGTSSRLLAEYTIGTPLFQKATLHLAGGKDFTIEAPRKSAKAIYVKGVKLNGQKITDWTLTHKQIVSGGTLQFQMSEKK